MNALRRFAFAMLAASGFAGAGWAQSAPAPLGQSATPPRQTARPAGTLKATPPPRGSQVLTLNQERFFNDSEFGKRVLAEIKTRSSALAAENHRIESELADEEKALTESRKTMTPAEFRPLADAFDAKVVGIRKAQAEKAAALKKWSESEQQRFVDIAYPELLNIANDLGAAVILDQRYTIVTSAGIDVTGFAIQQVNKAIGDGGPAPKE